MTDQTHKHIVVSMKSAAWERAKGEMRSMVALVGSLHGERTDENGRFQYELLSDEIEAFVKHIEDNEFHL